MNEAHSDDLQDRILRLIDGDLDEEAAGRLDGELRASREARLLYLQFSALHSALEEQEVSRASLGKVPVVPIELFLVRQRRRVVTKALLATAAVLIISAVVMWIKMVPAPNRVAGFRVAPDSVFTLTHAEENDAPEGYALGTGSRLQLTEGVMEGRFGSGVQCVIKAPCDLTVLAENRISIAEGVAWFQVPSKAVGFTVETSQLTVVDLGTEFGVLVPDRGEHEIHVMKGSVKVFARNATDQARELAAGQARKAGPAKGLIEVPVRSGKFMDTLPQRPSRLVSNGDLNEAVNQNGSAVGTGAFSLDPRTLEVLEDGVATGVVADEWLWSSLTRGFEYRGNGGSTDEDGAFVSSASGIPKNLKPRAIAQFARDLKATQGTRRLRIDVLVEDDRPGDPLTILVELYAWNSGQTGPKLSMGGAEPSVPSYNVTRPNDAKTILSTEISATSVANGSWETVELGTVALGSGYDFYAWRIGVMSATDDDRFAFDNIRIAY